MKLSRPSRVIAALIALFSILSMQFAVASYECQGSAMGQDSVMATLSTGAVNQTLQGMSGCQGMDAQQPSLCHAHDQVSHQSLDKPELPHVPPFTAATLTLVFDKVEVVYSSITLLPAFPLLTRTTAPPLAIRNCCFRI